VEGLALVMLCNHRLVTRKLAAHLLKEVKQIFATGLAFNVLQSGCMSLLEMMDNSCPTVVERILPILTQAERVGCIVLLYITLKIFSCTDISFR